MTKLYSYLILLLAALWLSAAAFSANNNPRLADSFSGPIKKFSPAIANPVFFQTAWNQLKENFAPLTFAQTAPKITVVKAGGGNGLVYGYSGVSGLYLECGFNCLQKSVPWFGPDINGYYSFGNLSALPGPDSDFTGWSGCDNNSAGAALPKQCSFNSTLNPVDRTVTANFAAPVANNILTVDKTGSTGTGKLTFYPSANYSYGALSFPSCGTNCSEITQTFRTAGSVVIKAAPDVGSAFANWTGCDSLDTSATPANCLVTANGAKTVVAVFTSATPPAVSGANKLIIKKSGPGLTNISGDLKCVYGCSETSAVFYSPTAINLTDSFSSISRFVGWNGCDASSAASCSVASVNSVKTVTLVSDTDWYSLDLDKTGSGQGTVTGTAIAGSSGQISCGPACNKDSAVFPRYETGTTHPAVTLSAVPAAGAIFTGWFDQSGNVYPGCSGAGNCVVAMDNNKRVSANFNAVPQTLTVNKTGSTGSGAISGIVTSGAGPNIVCDTGCASANQDYNLNSKITLTAVPAANSNFSGWTGNCDAGTGGASQTCVVSMTAAQTITAVFAVKTVSLYLYKDPSAVAAVTVSPVGTNCGTNCYSFNYGTAVAVSVSVPAANPPYPPFSGWSGDCSGATSPCSLTMNSDKTVYTSFTGNFFVAVTNQSNNGGSGVVRILGAASPAVAGGAFQYSDYFGGFLDESRYGVVWPNYSIACATGDSSGSDQCNNNYIPGDTITLVAIPDTNDINPTFSGWSNCESTGIYHSSPTFGSRDFPTCAVTRSASISATFDGLNISKMSNLMDGILNVAKSGDLAGAALVTDAYTQLGALDNGFINCGTNCLSDHFVGNQLIKLAAVPAPGTSLNSWNGCKSVDYSVNPPVCIAYVGDYPTLDSYSGQYITNYFLYTSFSNIGLPFYNANGQIGNYWGGAGGAYVPTPCKANTATTNFLHSTTDGAHLQCVTDNGDEWDFQAPSPGSSRFTLCPSDSNHYCLNLNAYEGYRLGQPTRSVTANFKYAVNNLTVIKSGSGQGVVTSSDNKIWCGLSCLTAYNYGASVTLTAAPAKGSVYFRPGSGYVTFPNSIGYSLSITQPDNENFVFNRTILNVVKVGNGSGRVAEYSVQSLTPPTAGAEQIAKEFGGGLAQTVIDCGLDCYEDFDGNASIIKLIALPDAASTTFAGWTNCDLVYTSFKTNDSCRMTVNDIKNLIARFDAIPAYGVSVFKTGLGKGTVSGSDNLVCDIACPQTYKIYSGQEMTALAGTINLSAAPDANSIFEGWNGCDSVNGTTCVLTANNMNKIITAIFNPATAPTLTGQAATASYTINVSKSGSGSVAGLAGVDCGTGVLSCSKTFNSPTAVNLTASAAAGSSFTGWGGDAASCGGNLSCGVNVACTPKVTVVKSGDGAGTVTGSGISCGGNCQATYNLGDSVTLTAAPAVGSTFTGWSGPCSGTGLTCNFIAGSDQSVGAVFSLISGFYLSPNPVSASVMPGSSVNTTITVNKTSGGVFSVSLGLYGNVYFNGQLRDTWPELNFSFNPQTCALSSNTCSSVLTISTAANTGIGAYSFNIGGGIFGNPGGPLSQTTVNLTTLNMDYGLSLSPNSGSLKNSLGNLLFSTAVVNKLAGSAQPVTISASGLPAGVTVQFGPFGPLPSYSNSYSCTPFVSSCNVSMQVMVINGASAGTYPITVTGSGSGIPARTATYNLTITP